MPHSGKEEKNDSESDDLAWFKEISPDAKAEFPPILEPRVGVTYLITFKEPKPRVVPDKFDKTGVIEVEYKDKLRSLFLGHTFLRQKIYALQKKHGSLMDIKLSLTRKKKIKDYIEYVLIEIP